MLVLYLVPNMLDMVTGVVRAERSSSSPVQTAGGCTGQAGTSVTEHELFAGVGIVMNQHLPVQSRALPAQPQLLPRAPGHKPQCDSRASRYGL